MLTAVKDHPRMPGHGSAATSGRGKSSALAAALSEWARLLGENCVTDAAAELTAAEQAEQERKGRPHLALEQKRAGCMHILSHHISNFVQDVLSPPQLIG